jgi:hypothetical protein
MSEANSMDCRVGRLAPERTCEQCCNGCDDCTDYEDDDAECPHCCGDGFDPFSDYLLPCPVCLGESGRDWQAAVTTE